eukprot:jgi/Mesvir1/5723/Mv09825-RA.2
MADDDFGKQKCQVCAAPAKLQCPRCLELQLPRDTSSFCSQDCFKKAWSAHKQVHKVVKPMEGTLTDGPFTGWGYVMGRGRFRQTTMPSFPWTGTLRPDLVSPRRPVPPEIPRPDWATTLGREVLDLAGRAVRPGVTTEEIDRIVHEATIAAGAYPSPLNYHSFPKSCCTSVNEVICHGIPDRRPLEEGDIINIDISVCLDGYHGDLNETFCVGNVSEEAKNVVRSAYNCLKKAIEMSRPGVRFRDVGDVISRHAASQGTSVVKSYCGHGIGTLFHCAPSIPHYSPNKAVGTMKAGQTFTIEPMINAGSWKDVTWPDGWTAVTSDGKMSAQFEHTLLVTDTGVEVLTARLPTSPSLGIEV